MSKHDLPHPHRVAEGPAAQPGIVHRRRQLGDQRAERVRTFDMVTGVDDGGGPVLTNVRLFLVFWGSAWGNNPTPSVEAVASAAAVLLYGPYMTALGQYHGIGPGVLEGKAVITTAEPPAPFGESDIQTFLQNQFTAGTIPNPTADNQRLYAVFPPAGAKYSNPDYGGAHWYFVYNSVKVPFAWVLNDGSLDDITWEFSHELAEACSDPNGDAIRLTGLTAPSNEIGDACETMTGKVAALVVQPYWSQRDGGCVIPQGQFIGDTVGVPSLIQGWYGATGNFELAAPMSDGGLAHWSRANDVPFVPWYGPNRFAQDVGPFTAVSLIQSNFTAGGNVGNLELVGVAQGSLLHYWREDVPPYVWHGPIWIRGSQPFNPAGNPSLIQGRFGGRGNFELVVPLADGGLAHFSRGNDIAGVPWFGPAVFARELGRVDAVSLIQSRDWTFGANIGTLEVIALSQGQLFHYTRDDRPPYNWYGPYPMTGISQPPQVGNPVILTSRFGVNGNFEVVVPLAGGGIAHYSCANDLPGRTWFGPAVFGGEIGVFDSVACIQSHYSSGAGVGNLEIVARSAALGELIFYWRDDNPPYVWNGACPRPAPS